jgi:hypothetical protein
MPDRDKFFPLGEQINKKDLEIILEVNKKAVEIETNVADQNEEIVDLLETSKDKQQKMDEKLDKIVKDVTDISKDLFKIQVLFITGVLGIIAEVIHALFLSK